MSARRKQLGEFLYAATAITEATGRYTDIADEGHLETVIELASLLWNDNELEARTWKGAYNSNQAMVQLSYEVSKLLKSHAADFEGIRPVPPQFDIASLTWIEGPPTCEGDWLVNYMTRDQKGRRQFSIIGVAVTNQSDDDKEPLLIRLPSLPPSTCDAHFVPMSVHAPSILNSCRLL